MPAPRKGADGGRAAGGLGEGRLFDAPAAGWRFDHRHVPQRLTAEWEAAHCSGLPAVLRRHLNVAAAVRLVQMSSGGSQAVAGERLGIPYATVSSGLRRARAFARDSASGQRFAAAVGDFAGRLHNSARLTDYARRRAELAGWVIPAADWERLASQFAPPAPGAASRDSQRRQRLFTVLAWAAATDGDPFLSPQVLREPRAASPLRADLARVRYQARARPGSVAAALARVAEDYGAALARAVDGAAAPS